MSRYLTIRLTERQADAALSAINAMLAGEEQDGDWPEHVTLKDLEGASDHIASALCATQKGGRR
jgi:hypothetical protein